MGLRMKNFNFMEIHWKIGIYGREHKKPIYWGGGELPKKGDLDSLQI